MTTDERLDALEANVAALHAWADEGFVHLSVKALTSEAVCLALVKNGSVSAADLIAAFEEVRDSVPPVMREKLSGILAQMLIEIPAPD